MWLFSLGPLLYGDSEIKIPFAKIIGSLVALIVPTIIGLYIQYFHKKAAAVLLKSLKFITGSFVAFVLTFGVYANWYVFDLVDNKVMFASAALPYLGFILGGFAAFVGRQSFQDIVTIAIETGIQNTALPLALLGMSITGPEKATSVVVPIISSTLTPIPLLVAYFIKELTKYFLRRQALELQAKAGEFLFGCPHLWQRRRN